MEKNNNNHTNEKQQNNRLLRHMCYAFRDGVLGQKEYAFPADTDFDELLELAEKHAIVGCVIGAVKRSPCPGEIMKKWKDKSGLSLRKEILFDNEFSKIKAELSENKIRFVPLKGIIIKELYPKKGMRQFCDFDVLIDKDKADVAKDIMVKLGYDVARTGKSEKKTHSAVAVIDCKKEPSYNFELHKKLFFGDKKGYFDKIWDRIDFLDECCFEGKMRDEDVYLYHLSHFHSHINERGGAGIRYLGDHYLICEKICKKKSFHRAYVEKILEAEGLLEFEEHINSLCEKLFGNERINLYDFEDFLLGGVHGSIDNKVKREVQKSGRGKYILKRLFPPVEEMAISYGFLEKLPFLLPFCWIIRLFAVGFSKKRRNIAKSELKSSEKQ